MTKKNILNFAQKFERLALKSKKASNEATTTVQAAVKGAISQFKSELLNAFNDALADQSLLNEQEYNAVTQATPLTLDVPFKGQKTGANKYQLSLDIKLYPKSQLSPPKGLTSALPKLEKRIKSKLIRPMTSAGVKAANKWANKESENFSVSRNPVAEIQ